MTLAKMIDGDLWMLASDAVKMAENAYKNGQVEEREACAKVCYELPWKDMGHIPSNLAFAAAIRARGQA